MLLLIKVLMVAIAGVLIGMPLFKPSQNLRPAIDGFSNNQKEAVFTILGEIEFEYRMNKLENDDYEDLKNKYQLQALNLLNEEDQDIEREIENQIKKNAKRKKE